MTFPAPVDQYSIPGRGTVYLTILEADTSRRGFEQLINTTVDLGGRPFIIRGVESYCVEQQIKGWPIGLLGEYTDEKSVDPAAQSSDSSVVSGSSP